MKIIKSTEPCIFSNTLNVKETMINLAHSAGQEELAAYLQTIEKFPIVTNCTTAVIFHVINTEERYNAVLEIVMPCGKSSLIWMPWLPHQKQPQQTTRGEYHHVNFGTYMLMPRRTRCYDYAYAFSGQVHPVEPETPAEISALYQETGAIFGIPKDSWPNMCLENNYANGREYISEHADDEKQFGNLHDVFCWVTGNASRTCVFRTKPTDKKKNKKEAGREILSLSIPAGLYVMHGREFQEFYTHEFPEVHKSLFESLRKHRSKMPGFPIEVEPSVKGAPRTALVQAAWIKEHTEEAERLIRSRVMKRKRKIEEDVLSLAEWCKERTSFTLRNFQK